MAGVPPTESSLAEQRYHVQFEDFATDQLASIEDYIVDQDAPIYAYDFTARIAQFCYGLGLFPHKHTERGDIWPNLHTVGFESSVVIAYMVDDKAHTVSIAGIFYRGQNWEAALKSSLSATNPRYSP